MKIYLIGSLRNGRVNVVGSALREHGWDVVDDWFAAGPEADDKWQQYEQHRGRTLAEALSGLHARHVFAFDRFHLETSDVVVLLAPSGKSGHLELGWALGRGKRGYVLFEQQPERFDVMYQFCTDVYESLDDLVDRLKEDEVTLSCGGF